MAWRNAPKRHAIKVAARWQNHAASLLCYGSVGAVLVTAVGQLAVTEVREGD